VLCEQYGAELVAVSKSRPVSEIRALYEHGHRVFGENRVQEWASKHTELPEDIRWHLIGHLQTNKVKAVVKDVAMIQSVDSPKLLEEVNKRAAFVGRVVDCLLQVHIATEESKFGFSHGELEGWLSAGSWRNLTMVRICGVMGIATLTDDTTQIRAEFRGLKKLFDQLRPTYFTGKDYFAHVSMGMSSDYQVALDEGSTMIRIGSLVFGERPVTTSPT
jgi:pyridoxal phosphate enzyme (YggS family)